MNNRSVGSVTSAPNAGTVHEELKEAKHQDGAGRSLPLAEPNLGQKWRKHYMRFVIQLLCNITNTIENMEFGGTTMTPCQRAITIFESSGDAETDKMGLFQKQRKINRGKCENYAFEIEAALQLWCLERGLKSNDPKYRDKPNVPWEFIVWFAEDKSETADALRDLADITQPEIKEWSDQHRVKNPV